jgi:hypothetical protein
MIKKCVVSHARGGEFPTNITDQRYEGERGWKSEWQGLGRQRHWRPGERYDGELEIQRKCFQTEIVCSSMQ